MNRDAQRVPSSPALAGGAEVVSLTPRDEELMRRAVRNALAEGSPFRWAYRIGDLLADEFSTLLQLAGGVVFFVAVWPQPLLSLGCALLIAGTVLGLAERNR